MSLSPKENLLRVIHHDHPEWVPNGMESVVMLRPPVVERPRAAGYDSFGVRWEHNDTAEGGTYPALGGHTIVDLARWRDQVDVPDVDTLDWNDIYLGWDGYQRVQWADIDRDSQLVCGILEFGLFERSYLLLGMEQALVAYLANPDAMEALVSAIADYKIALISRFDEVADLDMVWFGDDWGTQDNLFLPTPVWRRVIKPHTERVYACMQGRNILINQHSCGKIEKVVGDLVEMGADIWNPCQPCNDLAGLKRRYGDRLTFCGGFDSQFVLGRPGVTVDEVRLEVRRRIDQMAAGGGYVAAPSHSVPYDPALLAAMNDAIETYGRAIYRGTL